MGKFDSYFEIFDEIPLSIKDFILSPTHMNFKTISERQLRMMDFMLGGDIEKVFLNNRNLAVLVYGKGSGKDLCIVNMFCYVVYYLLCLKNPQKFFGVMKDDTFDIVNVAASREQANQVFFEMLKRKLQSWEWLKNRYKISYLSVTPDNIKDTVVILKGSIYFPKHIRLFSGHSDPSTLEGKNVFCFTIDEASGMNTVRGGDKAAELYRMLRTSAVSRFGIKHKGFIISYPRQKDDFTIKMFMRNLDNLNVYTDKGPTWEVKPAICFSGKAFRFKDYYIPAEFKEDFEKDPFGSMTCYLCIPAEVESPFIELPEKIDKVATEFPCAFFEDYTDGLRIKKRLVHWISPPDKPHVIGVDLGYNRDSACVTAVYADIKENQVIFKQDLLISWVPNYEKEELVSFENVGTILLELCSKLKVIAVVFDRWNSALLIEILNKNNIPSFDLSITSQDFFFLKELIYTNRISLLNDSAQLLELKKLVMLKGNKIEHLSENSKDRVDALVCALKILREKRMSSPKQLPGWSSVEDFFIDPKKSGFNII